MFALPVQFLHVLPAHFCLLCRDWVILFRFYIDYVIGWPLNPHFLYAMKKKWYEEIGGRMMGKEEGERERNQRDFLLYSLPLKKTSAWCFTLGLTCERNPNLRESGGGEEAHIFWKLRNKSECIKLFMRLQKVHYINFIVRKSQNNQSHVHIFRQNL